MNIVHISTECAPFAKVGGLGDVVHGLSRELKRKEHQVLVILPLYDSIDYTMLSNFKIEIRQFWTQENNIRYCNTAWSAISDGFKIIFIQPHHPLYYFTRGSIYGFHDDNDRFLYFCRAALDYLQEAKSAPSILHLHDWMTAVIPLLYKEQYQKFLGPAKTVLTIHNLEHQGRCAPHNLTKIGLDPSLYATSDELLDPLYPGVLNLLKGGIRHADMISSVSPTYTKEILSEKGGGPLYPFLIQYRKKFHGILNGIDTEYWNPESDPLLPVRYPSSPLGSKEKLKKVLEGKARCRQLLSKKLGLKKDGMGPLVATIARLVPQKGVDLMLQSIPKILELGGQYILLGGALLPELKETILDHQKRYRNNPNVVIHLEHSEALAHLIYAGSDLFFIPSLFEPCGLTQMIALRYGTVPIAHATGGLADTVFDVGNDRIPGQMQNGFTFRRYDIKEACAALERASALYRSRDSWTTLMKQGMDLDHSWRLPAEDYLKLYQLAMQMGRASKQAA